MVEGPGAGAAWRAVLRFLRVTIFPAVRQPFPGLLSLQPTANTAVPPLPAKGVGLLGVRAGPDEGEKQAVATGLGRG